MGILSRVLRPITGPGIFWPQDYPSTTTSVAGVDVTPAGAFGLPAFFAAVRAIAEDIAKLPFIVYEQLERGKRRAPEHPLYRVLHDAANPEMTAFVWRETSVGHLVTWGNCYSEIERNQQGEIVALWPIPPHLVKIKRHSNGERYYIIRAPVPDNSGNYDTVLEAKNMLHVPGLGYDGLIGYGPIDLLAKSIGVGLAAQDYASQSWANGSRPGGVLEVPSNLEMSDLALARLRQQYEAGHRGMSNAQRIAILQDGITFKEVGVTPEAAQFLETRQFQVSEIARGMRIPPHKIGDLSHATFCLPADTDVLTVGGPHRIVEVQPGTLVWSLDTEGSWRQSRVLHSVLSGYDRVLTIRTTNRTLRANARHPILARVPVRVPATVALGGGNVAGERYQVEWRTEFVEAGALKVGDTVVGLGRLPDEGSDHAPTRRVTEGFAEFCGLLLGDGNVIYAGEQPVGVTIARDGAARYMDHYRDVMRAEFTARNGRPISLQEQVRFTRFSSARAAEELHILGLHGTAHTKRVPDWIFRLTPALRLAVVRGFIEADGSVDKKGRITASSCNRALLSDIRHLGMGLGIPVTNVRKFMPAVGSVNGRAVVPSGPHFVFTMSDPGANRLIGSHDPQDQARLESGQPFGRKGRAYPRFGGDDYAQGPTELSRVVSIAIGQTLEPVYDLEVEGTHSFIADGVVVHNTNIEQQALEYVNDGLAGWAGRLEAQARKDLFTRPQDKDFFGELLFDALLRGDSITRARVWSIYHMNGNVTPNYINERENFPIREDAGGDEYLRPLNMAISGDPGNPALADNNIKQTIEAIPDTRPTNGRAPVEVPTA